jgi:hypothetical protein
MRRLCYAGILLLSYVFLTGMGDLPGSGRIRVPEPAVDYGATIIDQSDVSTRVEGFSFEGDTAVSGRLGSGRISIDFDKIDTISMALKEGEVTAEVGLKDGEKIFLVIEKGVLCYGRLPYGTLEIGVEEIRAIDLHGPVNP